MLGMVSCMLWAGLSWRSGGTKNTGDGVSEFGWSIIPVSSSHRVLPKSVYDRLRGLEELWIVRLRILGQGLGTT